MQAARCSAAGRDPRIDVLRGVALMMIFIDHIPYNSLSRLTLRSFGLSDAAELFVFLAGYASMLAYPKVFDRDGWRAGCRRIVQRCATLWFTQTALLLGMLVVLLAHSRLIGERPWTLDPTPVADLASLFAWLTLQTLPSYLDILPLYIVLLAAFPLILFGLRRNVVLTVASSLVLYGLALRYGWNLTNHPDPFGEPVGWTFDPFTWQLVFVLGAVACHGRGLGWRWLGQPPRAMTIGCLGILVFGVIAADPGRCWPTLADNLLPRAALDDPWKTVAAPWRIVHSMALLGLLLTSHGFGRLAGSPHLAVVRACGHYALQVFAAGCMLSLLGRIAFADFGQAPHVQLLVNLGGGMLQLCLGWHLAKAAKTRTAAPPAIASAVPVGASP